MNKIFLLAPGIGAHVLSFAPIVSGSEMYRTTFEIYTDPQKINFKTWSYEVWVSREYIEDKNALNRPVTPEEILDFVVEFLKTRWHESADFATAEEGAYLSNGTGVVLGNPRTFPYKTNDNEKANLQKTTVMVPRDTYRWLKEYALKNNTSTGDLIRRLITGFVEESKTKKLPSR